MEQGTVLPIEQRMAADFEAAFGKPPELIVRAPGRVNLIGEHTDYNGGFVLPMAISQATFIAARPRLDRRLHVGAVLLQRWATVDLDRLEHNSEEPWANYLIGVARELEIAGHPLRGADMIVTSSLPLGAGLSSSASLEMAVLKLFETMGEFELDDDEAAQLGRRVENDFIGVSTGIMDQLIIRVAREGHALFLDCQDLSREHVPLSFPRTAFVIMDTGVKREVAASKYNERVAQCRQALQDMNAILGCTAQTLRAFTAKELEVCRPSMSDLIYRRARHVITENARTQTASGMMKSGDATAMGMLMNASHESLATDYEVTGPSLDAMVRIAHTLEGCFGARMTGGGFGGCVVSLVEAAKVAAFSNTLLERYASETGNIGDALISTPSAGAGVVLKGAIS